MKLIFTICGIILVAMLLIQVFTNKNKHGKDELRKLIKEGAYLVDVRTVEEYEGGHVEGSVNIPLDKIEQNIDKFKDKKQIIVFCQSGRRSQNAKEILEKHGIKNVVNGGSWTDINGIVNSLNQ